MKSTSCLVFRDDYKEFIELSLMCLDESFLPNGNEIFKQVIQDYTVTGLGYFYAYVDREADYGRGEVKFPYVDPFRVVVDPNSRSRWFDDAAGMMLSTIMTKLQLMDLYPELSEENEEGKSLIDVIDKTISPMGGRLLKRWVALPSKNIKLIRNRHLTVKYLIDMKRH